MTCIKYKSEALLGLHRSTPEGGTQVVTGHVQFLLVVGLPFSMGAAMGHGRPGSQSTEKFCQVLMLLMCTVPTHQTLTMINPNDSFPSGAPVEFLTTPLQYSN